MENVSFNISHQSIIKYINDWPEELPVTQQRGHLLQLRNGSWSKRLPPHNTHRQHHCHRISTLQGTPKCQEHTPSVISVDRSARPIILNPNKNITTNREQRELDMRNKTTIDIRWRDLVTFSTSRLRMGVISEKWRDFVANGRNVWLLLIDSIEMIGYVLVIGLDTFMLFDVRHGSGVESVMFEDRLLVEGWCTVTLVW